MKPNIGQEDDQTCDKQKSLMLPVWGKRGERELAEPGDQSIYWETEP